MKAHRGNWGALTGEFRPREAVDPAKQRHRELIAARRSQAVQRQAALDVLTAAFRGKLPTIAAEALSDALRRSEAIGRIGQQITEARALSAGRCEPAATAESVPSQPATPQPAISVYQTGPRPIVRRRADAFEVGL